MRKAKLESQLKTKLITDYYKKVKNENLKAKSNPEKSKSIKKANPVPKPQPYICNQFFIESEFFHPNENELLKIFSWNINGIRAVVRKGAILDFINKENPDILCLNEIKIDQQALDKLNYNKLYYDKGYRSYWNCSKKKGYSGVAILTKYKPVNVFYGLGKDEHDNEGRLLTLEFPTFYLLAVYVPNSSLGCRRLGYRVNEWDIAFREYFNKLKEKKAVIICGDMNVAHNEIDLRHPKANEGSACFTKEERQSFTMHLESGFVDTFRHLYPKVVKYSYFCQRFPTCIVKNIGWRLDYFIVNHEAVERMIDSEILNDYRGSDHTPIKLTWKV
jgi:exodeoxyribonuclease III